MYLCNHFAGGQRRRWLDRSDGVLSWLGDGRAGAARRGPQARAAVSRGARHAIARRRPRGRRAAPAQPGKCILRQPDHPHTIASGEYHQHYHISLKHDRISKSHLVIN